LLELSNPLSLYPELMSFAINSNITFKMAVNVEEFIQLFNLPLSVEAHQLMNFQEMVFNSVNANN
jgi:hypothetical protein